MTEPIPTDLPTETLGEGPRSPRTPARRIWGALLIGALAGVSLAVYTFRSFGEWTSTAIAVAVVQQLLLYSMLIAALIGRRHLHRPIAAGRVIAIVPAFEESPDALNACIRSILDQKEVVIDEIHVVDDGSVRNPVQPWSHPRVVWHRKPNGGKRSAQHHVLSMLAERNDPVAFILTVDSDSILDEHAAAHLLRAFSNPRIAGATGVVHVSNAEQNLVTRIAEVNIGSAVSVGRVVRSLAGSLETTSGALAMYRAEIVLGRRDHYLASGNFGDDRMLTMYAELEGQVVAVREAITYSEMPANLHGAYRQQLRWAKSRVKLLPFALTNLPARHLVFPLLTLLRLLTGPVLLIFLVSGLLAAGMPNMLWSALAIGAMWIGIRYTTVGLYMLGRTDLSVRRRMLTWLLITPLELLYIAFFLFPIQYIAMAKLRDDGWGTRGDPGGANQHDVVAPAGEATLRPRRELQIA